MIDGSTTSNHPDANSRNHRVHDETGKPDESHPWSCCSPTMTESAMKAMMETCPCAYAMKEHRLAIFAVIAGVLLAFAISQVGGILGIVAFLRTL